MLWGALHPRKQSTNFCVFVDICIFLERDQAPPESHQRTYDPERLGVAAVGVKNTAGMAPKERDSQQKAEARPAQGRAPTSEQLCPPPRAQDPLRRAAHRGGRTHLTSRLAQREPDADPGTSQSDKHPKARTLQTCATQPERPPLLDGPLWAPSGLPTACLGTATVSRPPGSSTLSHGTF